MNASEQSRSNLRPDVSVIMPLWNCERYVAEAIESVRTQPATVTWELIIVDDGSTDASREIAQSYVNREPAHIRLFSHRNGVNLGSSATRNLGIAKSSADVLAFLDADDVWLPGRLDRHLQLLKAVPEAAMIYGQAERWFDFNEPFSGCGTSGNRNFVPPLIPENAFAGLLQPPTLLEWFLTDESMTPCTCAVLVRTEKARRVGGFQAAFRGLYDDQIFYAKLALREPIIVDLQCVARYRRHNQSCCSAGAADGTDASMKQNFLKWLAEYRSQERCVGCP